MRVLGISAYYHDSAAALVEDGRIVAAAQEERFTRKKHDSTYPHQAIQYCLRAGGVAARDLDAVVFYDKPFLKFDRLLKTYLAMSPRGFNSFRKSFPLWIKDKLFQKSRLVEELRALDAGVDWAKKLLFSEHHLSHAASAFFPSPFESAVILTLDGVGEWATTSVSLGKGREMTPLKEIHFPHSVGLLYSAFTYWLGFKVNSGEYKVMGLAPYGEPKYMNTILDHLVDLKSDGSFRLNLKYFDYCTGLKMTNRHFDQLFGQPARKSEELLTQKHMDIAASIQVATEEILLRLTRALAKETGEKNLCLAGGVALNCVANARVRREGGFENIWIQPAAGDSGGALGAALAAYHLHLKKDRVIKSSDAMQGAYLGPEYSQAEIESALQKVGAQFQVLSDEKLMQASVEALNSGKALGWHQGRMEYGPRALGNRSILADARSTEMQTTLNLKVKFRESFRPFAPAVLIEDTRDWFDCDVDSPYMLLTADVAKIRRQEMSDIEQNLFGIDKLKVKRSEIPAVTHVDYSARLQTVHANTNPRFHSLLKGFKERTGCPVLVNTSFNVRGEPIVNTPEDSFRCFMGTNIEALAIGNCFLLKSEQDPNLFRSYSDKFELD
jgi:carbamoyltransferase